MQPGYPKLTFVAVNLSKLDNSLQLSLEGEAFAVFLM